MRIVVMGAGSVGAYIVSMLADEGHDVLVVERDSDALDYVLAENDVMWVLRDGTDPDLLREAEVKDADFFISLADDDEINIVAGNMGKVLGAKFTIARVRSPKYKKNNDFMKNFMWIDHFLNPEMLSAREIELTLGYGMASSVESFFSDKVEMIQFHITKKSNLAGKTLAELTADGLLDGLLITVVDRGDSIYIPGGDFKINIDDNIHVIGTPHDLRKLYLREFGRETDIKSSLIIGASKIAYYLAENILAKGYDVKVIEVDEARAPEFHHLLPNAIVIHGDGANSTFLAEENFEDKTVTEKIQQSVMSYFIIHILIFFALFAIVAIDINDFLEAFTAVATTYNGLGQFGEAQSFYELREASKFVLSIAMLLGRLEIYPLLLLLIPSTYKRR